MSDFKGRHFEGEIVLWAVRWYCRYGVSYHDLEQMMSERGVSVDHSTIYRWVQKYAPEIEKRPDGAAGDDGAGNDGQHAATPCGYDVRNSCTLQFAEHSATDNDGRLQDIAIWMLTTFPMLGSIG